MFTKGVCLKPKQVRKRSAFQVAFIHTLQETFSFLKYFIELCPLVYTPLIQTKRTGTKHSTKAEWLLTGAAAFHRDWFSALGPCL